MEQVRLLQDMQERNQRYDFITADILWQEFEAQGKRKTDQMERMDPPAPHPYSAKDQLTGGRHNVYSEPASKEDIQMANAFNEAARARKEAELPYFQYRHMYFEVLVLFFQ